MQVNIHVDQSEEELQPSGLLVAIFLPTQKYTIWTVWAEVVLSEEEQTILSVGNLWENVVYVRRMPQVHFDLMSREEREQIGHIRNIEVTVDEVLNNPTGYAYTVFYDADSAELFADELQKKILPAIKALILRSSKGNKPQIRSFEL